MRAGEWRSPAAERAETGAQQWAEAVRQQRHATPHHADHYAVAAALVSTLYALEDLTAVLRDQVAGYGDGRALYDDTSIADPADRLVEAAEHLALMREAIVVAHGHGNRFWSAIGHIGVRAGS